MSNGNGNGCVPIEECGEKQSPPQLKIVENPQGSGGQALTHNFKELHYRQPACSYEEANEPEISDGDPNYCVGSRWLQAGTSEGEPYKKMWICVDGGEASSESSGALWVPWFRWRGDWKEIFPRTLVVDTNIGMDGEIRRFTQEEETAGPIILVPKKTDDPNSAVLLGQYEEEHGGDDRGASAIDFQNDRDDDNQVAAAERSFIAGGKNNRVATEADYALAEGLESLASGKAAHAEGYNSEGTKDASGEGSHAEGHVSSEGSIEASGNGAHAEALAV